MEFDETTDELSEDTIFEDTDFEFSEEVANEAVETDAEFLDELTDSEVLTEEVKDVDTDVEWGDFAAWKDDIQEQNPDLSDAALDALWTAPENRSWHQTEMADEALHPEYDRQTSFLLNDETGELEEVPYGTKGSQRPDGIFFAEDGITSIREDKNYGSISNLERNMEKQTADRRELFGDDIDLTYVVAPRFTVEEAENLQQFCEDDLDVNIEWQLK